MMKTLIFGLAIAAVFAGGVYGGDSVAGAGGRFVDPRDNQTYRTVRIGNLTWMAENLNYQTDNSWCYDNDPSYCQRYGRLYTWNAAMSACPSGWRLPSDRDWDDLINTVGGRRMGGGYTVVDNRKEFLNLNDVNTNANSRIAGGRLKSEIGWYDGAVYADDYGFSALPGGVRLAGGGSRDLGFGYWWSATERDTVRAQIRAMESCKHCILNRWFYKGDAISVRCVRD